MMDKLPLDILWLRRAGCTLLLVLAMIGPRKVSAQTDISLIPRGATTNYHYAEPNELTIIVSVLGEVKSPGRYEISRKMNLLDLLSLAGGWTASADMADVNIIRSVQLGARVERKMIRLDLEDPLRVPESALSLEQGDLISVGKSSQMSFQDAIAYVSACAVILTAIIALTQ
jgi:hypothetical protein